MDMIFCRGMRFGSNFGFSPILVTKNFLEANRFMRCPEPRRWRLKLFVRHPHYRNLSCSYVPFLKQIKTHELPFKEKFNKNILVARYCNTNATKGQIRNGPNEKLSLFAKMKQLTKNYWHIVIPVHVLTSIGWVALFYTTIVNGMDIAKILEFLHINKKYIDMVQNSTAGTWAITYLLYKIFTPLRYTVTIGCTTMAIKRLSKSGIVKPLSFGKQSQAMNKTLESNKATTGKREVKVERQTDPPKT